MNTEPESTKMLTACSILVVEDEYIIAEGIVDALERAGASVIGPVPSLAEAMALVLADGIDGAVLDINLRGELVYPVANALLERGVPFLFATGYDAGAIPASYDQVPRREKPVPPSDLARVLRRGLEHTTP
jgi:CheY-like chemotaxis protein